MPCAAAREVDDLGPLGGQRKRQQQAHTHRQTSRANVVLHADEILPSPGNLRRTAGVPPIISKDAGEQARVQQAGIDFLIDRDAYQAHTSPPSTIWSPGWTTTWSPAARPPKTSASQAVALADLDLAFGRLACGDGEDRPGLAAAEEAAGRHLQHVGLFPDQDPYFDPLAVAEVRPSARAARRGR